MALKDESFSMRVLLRRCPVVDKSAIGTPQCRFALRRPLPCCLRAPAGQNFTQVPDRDVDGGSQVYCRTQLNLAPSAIAYAIVAEPDYFGAHALLPNQSAGRMAVSG